MPRSARAGGRKRKIAGTGLRAGMVRVATTMAVPVLLREHGVDPASLLGEFGLKPDVYDDPDSTIPFATSCAILGRAAEATQCSHFGLLVGQRAGLSMLGPLGYLMQSSPDVRSALADAATHFRVHNMAAALDFSEDDSTATLGFRILQPGIPGHLQLLSGSMAIAFNALRSLCGPGWRPYELRFAQKEPADTAPFRRFFQAPLVFDADESSLVFSRHWLDRPPLGADPILNLMMSRRIAEIESASTDDLVAELARKLPALILGGNSTLRTVAARVGLGARSLNRRLAAQGTSFHALIEEARFALARQLLQDTQLPAQEIAGHLGYANASAFTRAFRRWSGTGPAEWRESGHRSRRARRPARA